MSDSAAHEEKRKRDPMVVRGRLYRITIYLLIVLALVLLLWKVVNEAIMEDKHEKAMDEQRAQAATVLEERTMDLLRTVGISAGMAMRESLLADDATRLRQYADILVRETSASTVTVSGADGMVLASSDRNREGTRLESTLQALLTTLDGPVVDDLKNGRYRVVVPLTGVNQRVGVLVMQMDFPAESDTPEE